MRRAHISSSVRTFLAAAVALAMLGVSTPVAVAYSLFFPPNAPAAPFESLKAPQPLAPRRLPHKRREPKKLPLATPVKGPLLITISIADQRLTLFDDGVPIAHAPVSTGMADHPTPMGLFSVIQKERYHRSNIYSGAPMPFMQRITWSGVALHAGVLPGYPASHGCIRMPPDFAIKLYGMTKVGVRVVITRHEVAPVDIEHAELAALKTGDAVSRAGDLKPDQRAGVEVADATSATQSSVIDSEKTADRPGRTGVPSAAAPTAAPPAAWEPASQPAASELPAARSPAPQPTSADASPATPEPPTGTMSVPPADTLPVTASLPINEVFVPPSRPARPLRAGPVSIFISRKEGRLYVRKGFDPLFSVPVSIARPDQPIGTHLFVATALKQDGASFKWMALSLPESLSKKAEPLRSRRTARRGRAENRDHATVPRAPSLTAAAALDRINLPPELVQRISPLLSVGASLTISDRGLGPETGVETDFIVLTSPMERPARRVRHAPPMVWTPRKFYRDAITFW